jgi:hypothetical protein
MTGPSGPLVTDDGAPAVHYTDPASPLLRELRRRYGLDTVTAGARDDPDALHRLRGWVHERRPPDGESGPCRGDPLTAEYDDGT